MRKLVVICLLLINVAVAQNPEVITIEQCIEKAINSYPIINQKDIYTQTSYLNVKNINKDLLPKLNVNAQATYQSEVMDLDIPIPNFTLGELSKDQYRATLDVNQVIYDGGMSSAKKSIEDIDLQVNLKSVDVELYKLKERVSLVYFNIFLLQEKIALLESSSKVIDDKLKVLKSALQNGVVAKSDINELKAEILKIDQQIIDATISKETAIKVLSRLINEEVSSNASLELPDFVITENSEIIRPENELFELNKLKINSIIKTLNSKRRPMLFGFGQVGYGRPGLNPLNDEFDSFYIVGAKLTWNIWDWNKTNTDKKILLLKQDIIQTQKESFEKNINIALESELATIEKYQKLIEKDIEIIELRESITKSYSSKLENGLIIPSDYLKVLNDETEAKINMQFHKILLSKSKINYQTIKGN